MKWIKVSDKLPSKKDYEVLIWSHEAFERWEGDKEDFRPTVAQWDSDKKKFCFVDNRSETFLKDWDSIMDISHWMPMPEPPTQLKPRKNYTK